MKNPTAKGKISENIISKFSYRSKQKPPRITGIAIKNEKRVASSFFTPKNNAVEIVIPDLEIPGKRAIH